MHKDQLCNMNTICVLIVSYIWQPNVAEEINNSLFSKTRLCSMLFIKRRVFNADGKIP